MADENQERDVDLDQVDDITAQSVERSDDSSAANDDVAEQELKKLRTEVAELKDKYLRSLADFENYKKRVLKERSELIKYQGDKILADLLEVVDNLERALASAGTDGAGLVEGVGLIHKLFIDTLARWEVRQESAMGAAFDPLKHKAVSRVSVTDAAPGTVIGEMRKTYFYRDRLLRPAEVVVAAEAAPKPVPVAEAGSAEAEKE